VGLGASVRVVRSGDWLGRLVARWGGGEGVAGDGCGRPGAWVQEEGAGRRLGEEEGGEGRGGGGGLIGVGQGGRVAEGDTRRGPWGCVGGVGVGGGGE